MPQGNSSRDDAAKPVDVQMQPLYRYFCVECDRATRAEIATAADTPVSYAPPPDTTHTLKGSQRVCPNEFSCILVSMQVFCRPLDGSV